ncbi:Uncharacterised protein [Serratia plymuthica]|uniref:Uncharacterized protein n=1 Tax=Serratia plymuthica TaxID=82996 RepID=A0A2X4VIF0_SERPL|nr:Uncharacterised protein [Serratia plymuthica]
MKVIDSSLLEYVSGGQGNNGGDRTDNGGRSRGNSGNSNNNSSNVGFYKNNTSESCVNGIFTGMFGGPVSLAVGAINGGCFTEKVKVAVASEWEAEETNRIRPQLAVKEKTVQVVVPGKDKRKF